MAKLFFIQGGFNFKINDTAVGAGAYGKCCRVSKPAFGKAFSRLHFYAIIDKASEWPNWILTLFL
jgi:hypothetical protein